MANFNKSFNFRGGFQVDTDTLLVRGQNVGIGSSVPTQRLDVNGVVKANGLIVDSTRAFFIETASVGVLSAVTTKSGIFTGTNGIATYYGDGSQLLNLPTSQWLDIDVGLGFTSIYAAGNVGVDTTDPRYAFQVGGTPFPTTTGPSLPAQDGVGIEDGEIYASGIISTRGNVQVEGEFVGLGSNITSLNADNLTAGSIGSMRYGDLIVTKQVIADSFIGTATKASGLSTDISIDIVSIVSDSGEFGSGEFDSAKVNDVLSVGDSPTPLTGIIDFEVFKTSSDSRVMSISPTNAFSFVGSQRIGGAAREFGGLRMVNASANHNLDLVNYDIGDINFILHDGSGGPTDTFGSFKWVYGQGDRILASLSREGSFNLSGSISSSPTFSVSGISTFGGNTFTDGSSIVTQELSVGSGLTVTGSAYVGSNMTIGGDLDITGTLSPSSVSFPESIEFTNVAITSSLTVQQGANSVNIDPLSITVGLTTVDGNSINVDTVICRVVNTTENVTSNNLIFSNQLSNNSGTFSVNNSGAITADTINASTITATTVNANVNGTLTGNINSTTGSNTIADVTITDATITNLTLSGDISAPTNNATFDTIAAITGNIGEVNADFVDVGTIRPSSGSDVIIGANLDGNNSSTISNFTSIVTDLTNTGRLTIGGVELSFSNLDGNIGAGATGVRLEVYSDDYPDGGFIDLVLTPIP